jgi:hypothetical protein
MMNQFSCARPIHLETKNGVSSHPKDIRIIFAEFDRAGKALQKLSRQWRLKAVAAQQLLGSRGLGMSRCFSATISTWCARGAIGHLHEGR